MCLLVDLPPPPLPEYSDIIQEVENDFIEENLNFNEFFEDFIIPQLDAEIITVELADERFDEEEDLRILEELSDNIITEQTGLYEYWENRAVPEEIEEEQSINSQEDTLILVSEPVAEPIGGMKSYFRYISEKIEYPEEAKN